jgi:hypothetical protein
MGRCSSIVVVVKICDSAGVVLLLLLHSLISIPTHFPRPIDKLNIYHDSLSEKLPILNKILSFNNQEHPANNEPDFAMCRGTS